jgi:hypothetical protein
MDAAALDLRKTRREGTLQGYRVEGAGYSDRGL